MKYSLKDPDCINCVALQYVDRFYYNADPNFVYCDGHLHVNLASLCPS